VGDASVPPESGTGRRTTLRLAAIPAEQAPQPEHGLRIIAIIAVIIMLGVLMWALTRPMPMTTEPLVWNSIAPPQSTPIHPWRWIVIHHSASRRGNAQIIDNEHLNQRGWDGIGYHFVIGNGVDMPMGRIEGTFRWRLQQHGAHAGSSPEQKQYNQDGIGICVIGNYDQERVPQYVEQRLVEICAQLIDHTPTLSVGRIIGHKDIPGKITACPGQAIDLERLRFLVRQELQRRGMTVR
jgi:hypothetical protein